MVIKAQEISKDRFVGIDEELVAKKLEVKGEWTDEPDYAEWKDEETGYSCLILRNGLGALCGYVGLPETHPLYKIKYFDCTKEGAKFPDKEEVDKIVKKLGFETTPRMLEYMYSILQCQDPECRYNHSMQSFLTTHGGITFADFFLSINIVNKSNWFIGFDCGHYKDLVPFIPNNLKIREGDIYRNIEYVIKEIKNLALQLKKYERDIN